MSSEDRSITPMGQLISLAIALGAEKVAGWSLLEASNFGKPAVWTPQELQNTRNLIEAGDDPLGGLFCRIRSSEDRRSSGAVYTPPLIVDAMVDRAAEECDPTLIVDPGVGSGRFLAKCGKRFPKAKLIGIDLDPIASILARGHLAAAGLADRSTIIYDDYRSVVLPPTKGKTLFIGNPPYVRHHLIEPHWKNWLGDTAAKWGLNASALAGLHVYFFVSTLLKARKDDHGIFITAAEWLDVNYGSVLRQMLLGDLGGKSITIVEPSVMPFADTMTTAAITSFQVQSKPTSILFSRVKSVKDLTEKRSGMKIGRKRLESEQRWSYLTKVRREIPSGFVELGEICRVHRGQVTGNNRIWIAGEHSADLPDTVLYPSVTKARELIAADGVLDNASALRCVIDIPAELDALNAEERASVEKFLNAAKQNGAHLSYVAQNRRAWWAVNLRAPAPILCTYMARRAPAFVENVAEARHINIAHGIYPRESLTKRIMTTLVSYLSRAVNIRDGRTYAGGLVKFEPREMERLAVPSLDLLRQGFDASTATPI
jgi:adenine-specific DNA-methyltransferase